MKRIGSSQGEAEIMDEEEAGVGAEAVEEEEATRIKAAITFLVNITRMDMLADLLLCEWVLVQ